ncbi:hypothetical protein GC170_14625 [bacterium]|nr:hypothetical protein [bacterium]
MKTAPDPSLKPVQFEIAYNQDNTPYPVILFDDGSIWRYCLDNWHCVWQPESAAAEPSDAEAMTMATLKGSGTEKDNDYDWLYQHQGKAIAARDAEIDQLKKENDCLAEYEKTARFKVKEKDAEIASLKKQLADQENRLREWEEAAMPWSVEFIDYFHGTSTPTPETLTKALEAAQRWIKKAKQIETAVLTEPK